MKPLLAFMLAFGLVAAIVAQRGPVPCPPDVCDDPSKPWMRGSIEYSCARPLDLARLRREHPERTIKECACAHTCDPNAEHADETQRRAWDYRCEARCNPASCACPHPCADDAN